MTSENETVAEVLAEFGKIIELMRKCRCVGVSLWNCLKFKLRIEAAYRREVAELRECLNEAIREKCPFTRMSCKHGEPCEYVCGTDKWRKALEGAKDEGK